MTILRDEFVFVQLKSGITASATTIPVLAKTGAFRNMPDPAGVDEAYGVMVDNPDSPSKWEIFRYDDSVLNGAGDGYDLNVIQRAVDSSAGAGNGESFSAGHYCYQQLTVAEANAFLALKLSLSGGTMTGALDMGANSITNIGNVTGLDANLVTGTKGTNGNLVQWNADGDAVDAGITASNVALIDGSRSFTGAVDMDSTLNVDGAATFNSTVGVGAGTVTAGYQFEVQNTGHTKIRVSPDSSGNFDSVIDITSRGASGQFRNAEIQNVGVDEPGATLRFMLDDSSAALTERMKLDRNGLLTVGGGINFGQSDLDYYDEGTFTLTPDNGDYTYSQTNNYIRNGSELTLYFNFEVTATNTAGTGTFKLQGAPFPVASNAHNDGGFNLLRGLTVGGEFLGVRMAGSDITLVHFDLAGGNETVIVWGDWGATFWLRGRITYRV